MFDTEDDVDDKQREEALRALRAARIRNDWEDLYEGPRDQEWFRHNVLGRWPEE